MRLNNLIIFDEIATFNKVNVTQLFTPHEAYEAILGRYDQLSFHVVSDEVVVSSGYAIQLSITLKMSSDGIHYVAKNASPEIAFTTLGTVSFWGNEPGTKPNYRLIRPEISMKQTGPGDKDGRAHVQVYVTARDQGGVLVVARSGTQNWVDQPSRLYHPPDAMKEFKDCVKKGHPMWWCNEQYEPYG